MRRGLAAVAFVALLQSTEPLMPCVRAGETFGATRLSLPVAPDPSAFVVKDFNGDGRPDLALTHGTANAVSVLLGDGLGYFHPRVEVGVGDRPEAVTATDLDSDGTPDLVVVNRDSNSVSVLLGDGSGSFARFEDTSVGLGPTAVVASELNGDGMNDLVVVNEDGNSITVLFGNGSGGFSQVADYPVGLGPIAAAVGEFGGDAHPDVAVVNRGSSSVSVLYGEAPGSFVQTPELGIAGGPAAIAAADFDGDARAELAVAGHDNDTVSILDRSSQGELSVVSVIDVGDGPEALVVGDFNNDGMQDLGVANPSRGTATLGGSGSLTILLGDLSGGFLRSPDIVTTAPPSSLRAGDLDGNGAQDLALLNRGSASVSILSGNGLGGFARTPGLEVNRGPRSIVVAEFNGDGNPDLAVGNFTSLFEGSVDILAGDGLGGFLYDPAGTLDLGVGPFSIGSADLDGSGMVDLIYGDPFGSTVTVLLNEGDGHFASMPATPIGQPPRAFTVGDFNADGAQDVVTINSLTATASLLLGDGSGALTLEQTVGVGNGPVAATTGDLNRDGRLDLAVANLLSDSVSILLGDGTGNLAPATNFGVGDAPSAVAAGYFNADEKLDLAVANRDDDTLSILLGDGHGSFSITQTGVGRGPESVSAVDLNDDGATDLILANGLGNSVSVLIADGRGTFLRAPEVEVGDGPIHVAVGEFNSDGKTDAAVANFDSDFVSVLINRLSDRADVDGSNRIDALDTVAVGLAAGLDITSPNYPRNVDVDLDGLIGGDDLALIAARFGELRNAGSPLRPALSVPTSSQPDAATLHQFSAEGDLLTVRILIEDDDDPVTGADFTVAYGPTDGLPGQVMELLDGFTPGSYMRGGSGQVFTFDRSNPGEVGIVASRFPQQEQVGSGSQPLMDLVFRALREGQAEIDFAPLHYSRATLLDAAGNEVPGVSFVGPVSVEVAASGADVVANRIGVAPRSLDFGFPTPGTTLSRILRISNFGFSEIDVRRIRSTITAFTPFSDGSFTIPQFGFVELTVEYAAEKPGLFAGQLLIEFDGPNDVVAGVPLLARSGLELLAEPAHLDLGRIAVGDELVGRIQLTNLEASPLTLTVVTSNQPEFEPLFSSLALLPEQPQSIEVRFRPLTVGDFCGLVHLQLEGTAHSEAILTLSGTGTEPTVP